MTRRLALLTLLAGVLVAVGGPHDHARVALQRSGPTEGIWVLEAASGAMAFVPHTDHGFQPAWSPDGTRIAFARGGDQDDGLPFHIHTVALASGRTTQVTSGRVVDLMPTWQPL